MRRSNSRRPAEPASLRTFLRALGFSTPAAMRAALGHLTSLAPRNKREFSQCAVALVLGVTLAAKIMVTVQGDESKSQQSNPPVVVNVYQSQRGDGNGAGVNVRE